jgi:transcriptional regulator with XRE-family HTH domain
VTFPDTLRDEDELDIGARIKQRREEVGLSLRELAKKTNLTASFLSQAERNLTNTSIDSLRRIAAALNVSILHFLAEARHQVPIVRKGNRAKLTLPDSGLTYELLVPDLTRKMEVFIGKLSPGKSNVVRKPLREPTEECILVLTGTLEIGLDSNLYDLEEGDSIYFDGGQLSSLSNSSETERVEWVSIITPPVF